MKFPTIILPLLGLLPLLAVLPGCATSSRASAATRSLKVVKSGNSVGLIKYVNLQEIDDRLYVSATVALGPFDHDARGARIEVDLLNASGGVIASDKDKLPRTPARHRSHTKQKTMHTSFPLPLVPRAATVRVSYVR